MRKKIKKALLILLIFASGSFAFGQIKDLPASVIEEDGYLYKNNELYVKFENSDVILATKGSRDVYLNFGKTKSNKLKAKYGLKSKAYSMRFFEDADLLSTVRIQFDSTQKLDDLIKAFEDDVNISYVEKVPVYELFAATNDPYYGEVENWNLSWYLDLINAEEAWQLQKASPNIKVAIIDNAIWGEHEDLQLKPENQYNSVTKKTGSSSPPKEVIQNEECTNADYCTSYDWSHGTHCAGLVGAINNNGIGIASIGSGVTLMGVASQSFQEFLITLSFDGIIWAAENGANIISCSWGGGSATMKTYNNILKECYRRGIIVVFASGNASYSTPTYPASSPYVISVGSVDSDRSPSFFTNYGPWVDIAAPGGFDFTKTETKETSIISTTYCKSQKYRLDGYTAIDGKYYDGMAGTSMSTPILAGLVGLLLSKDSTLTTPIIRSLLMNTGSELNYTKTNMRFNAAASVIDAAAALKMVDSLNYPGNVVAINKGAEVDIIWDLPINTNKEVERYRIYRNRELIDEYVISRNYRDIMLPDGEYEYSVDAIYTDGTISLRNSAVISTGFKYNISLSAQPSDAGVVEGSGEYLGDSFISLKAIPNEGYDFVQWNNVEGVFISKDKNCEFYLMSDTNIVGVFKKIEVSLEDKLQQQFSITPNPAKDYLNIECNSSHIDFIEILGINGQLYKRIEVGRQSKFKVDISTLRPAIYILRGISGKEVFITKFIKI